jgi:tetrapyrrole methylase family protein/MazG family protein
MSDTKHTITVVGLGPGDLRYLTQEAVAVLRTTPRLYLRTVMHPIVPDLQRKFPHLEIESFDSIYESASSFEEVYTQIVDRLLALAAVREVAYGVPGSPSLDETSVRLLLAMAKAMNQPTRLVQGMSYIEPVLAAVGTIDAPWLMVIDATDIALFTAANAVGEVVGKPGRLPWRAPLPTVPLLVSQLYSQHVAIAVKLWLSRYWPEQHEVVLVRAAGTATQEIQTLPIHRLDRVDVDHLTTLYVPAIPEIENIRTFAGVMNVTRTLRAPGGCPWDREQTHQTLKTHLLEETYEVLETLDQQDYSKLAEELGDLLFQVTIHAQIAAEHDEFDIEDVFANITTKLIRRHPHVFGEMELETAADVLRNWETFKQREQPERQSVLSSIPTAMPALPYSYAIQKRVANQGFEWPDMASLLAQVRSEIDELDNELRQEAPRERLVDELGDILFALVSVGRRLKIDPEEALRQANRKFVARFRSVESLCAAQGVRMRDLSPQELDRLWQEAKERVAEDQLQ